MLMVYSRVTMSLTRDAFFSPFFAILAAEQHSRVN